MGNIGSGFLFGGIGAAVVGLIAAEVISYSKSEKIDSELTVTDVWLADNAMRSFETATGSGNVVSVVAEHNYELTNNFRDSLTVEKMSLYCSNKDIVDYSSRSVGRTVAVYKDILDLKAKRDNQLSSSTKVFIRPNDRAFVTVEYLFDFYENNKRIILRSDDLVNFVPAVNDRKLARAMAVAILTGVTIDKISRIKCSHSIQTDKGTLNRTVNKPQLVVDLPVDIDYLNELATPLAARYR